MIKQLFAGILSLTAIAASAQELTNYNDIANSLTQGKLITVVFNNANCVVNNSNSFPLQTATAIFKPQAVLMSDDGKIAARGTWFSTGIPQHVGGAGINQQYSILITKDQQMNVRYQFFNADNGQPTDIKDITLICELGKGFKVYN